MSRLWALVAFVAALGIFAAALWVFLDVTG